MDQENRPLDERERAFCAEYVRNGGNGKAAAIHAGYGIAGAAVQAGRLLKRPAIQREIEARRKGAKAIVGELISKAVAVISEERPSASVNPERAEAQAEMDRDLASGLSRAYVIAGLIDNFEMALGRRSKKITKLVTHRLKAEDGKVTTSVEAMQVEVFEVDHAGANRAGELLLAECPPDDPGKTIEGEPEHRLAGLLDAFRQGQTFEVRPATKEPVR